MAKHKKSTPAQQMLNYINNLHYERMKKDDLLLMESKLNMMVNGYQEEHRITKAEADGLINTISYYIDYWLEIRNTSISDANVEEGDYYGW